MGWHSCDRDFIKQARTAPPPRRCDQNLVTSLIATSIDWPSGSIITTGPCYRSPAAVKSTDTPIFAIRQTPFEGLPDFLSPLFSEIHQSRRTKITRLTLFLLPAHTSDTFFPASFDHYYLSTIRPSQGELPCRYGSRYTIHILVLHSLNPRVSL
jgi:hypothetical protein